MHRRVLLATLSLGTLGLAGCLGGDAGGGFSGTDESNGGDGDDQFSDLAEPQRSFVTRLDNEIEVTNARTGTDALVVTVQTTGTDSEDLRLAAEVYVNFVNRLERDLRVHVEDRGLRQSTFSIRREWATQFRDGRIDDDEYRTRIDETRGR